MPPEMSSSVRRERVAQGFERLRAGDHSSAIGISRALLAEAEGDPEVQYLAAEVAIAQGDLATALRHAELALTAAPDQWPLAVKRARILLALRRRDAFRLAAEDAVRLAGQNPEALWELGRAYMACDDPESARPLFERAVRSGGSEAGLYLNLATARFFSGDVDAAEAAVEDALVRSPTMGEAIYLRSTLRRVSAQDNHVEDLQSRLQYVGIDPDARAAALYALAKEYEDLGRNSESIAALLEGAELKRARLAYQVSGEIGNIEAIRNACSASALAGMSGGESGEGAIFIVGMPRSGTTLLERMLDQLPGVRSAGELMDFKNLLADAAREASTRVQSRSLLQTLQAIDFDQLGREYMRGAREAARGEAVFIDKMPVNFLYCGLIGLALPKARILHLVRDPMDAGYAVFKTLFNQAYFFSYDQQQLADYLACYRRLMAHWHEVMPGRILDVPYEGLVTDTEAQTRRVLEFCGLDWRPNVLAPDTNSRPSTTASAAQVREPVHARSVGRWRHFADALEPMRGRLHALGIVDSEGRPAGF